VVDRISDIAGHISQTLDRAACSDAPFRHWSLHDVLPAAMAEAFTTIDVPPPPVGAGTRAAENKRRYFLSADSRASFPFCADLAEALQAPAIVGQLSRMCDVDLDGSFLRIEYCQDQEGFWLEPHTDIGAKLFTAQIYLSRHEGPERMGTDFLDADHNLVVRTPGTFNTGNIFVPAPNTWHAFGRRKIDGLRRSLIVNYVRPEWQSRHELAFPDEPVRGDPLAA
jgi:hypothetical protein